MFFLRQVVLRRFLLNAVLLMPQNYYVLFYYTSIADVVNREIILSYSQRI